VPELPDIVVYVEALEERIQGRELLRIRITSPFLLRSVSPPAEAAAGRRVTAVRRLGKRIVIGLDGDLFLILHLMIAGRLHWRKPQAPVGRPRGLAAFDFRHGSLVWTEAGSKKRASLHVVSGEAALAAHDPGGLEVQEATPEQFAGRLCSESHTLKRALTDPHLLSGIGNAYSDEILHRAGLSPFQRTSNLDAEEMGRLYGAARDILHEWTGRLRRERGGGFPEKVTAFRQGMAVHGRYRLPCPVCGSPVQRVVYAENEANYCVTCQTGGRLLADRALSRLLRGDWPRTLEELEARRTGGSNLLPAPGVE
jgi:formamidopyrimidine-DNA glycosylase